MLPGFPTGEAVVVSMQVAKSLRVSTKAVYLRVPAAPADRLWPSTSVS
jgi:hypothetical protein